MTENSQYYGKPTITGEYSKGYQQGREDKEKQIRDKMVRTSYGLGAYLTISEEDWEQIKEQNE